MKRVYQSPDLPSRAAWAGGLVVAVIVGFSIFTPAFERRVMLWLIAVVVAIYFWAMARSRVEVDGTVVTVVNYGRRRRIEASEVVECGMDTRPLVGPVGVLRLRDGSRIYLYGLQPRRIAGDDTLRSDELSALTAALGSGGPMSPS